MVLHDVGHLAAPDIWDVLRERNIIRVAVAGEDYDIRHLSEPHIAVAVLHHRADGVFVGVGSAGEVEGCGATVGVDGDGT